MTFIPAKPFISYKHVKARTPEQLEIEMLKISVNSTEPTSFTAPFYVNGFWYAWYLYDYSKDLTSKQQFKTKGGKVKGEE